MSTAGFYTRINPTVIARTRLSQTITISGGEQFFVNADDTNGYRTIQAAVTAAEAAADFPTKPITIIIAPGQYTENVTINQQGINLVGYSPTVFGGGAGPNSVFLTGTITINAPNCGISKMFIRPTTGSGIVYSSSTTFGVGLIEDSVITVSALVGNCIDLSDSSTTIIIKNTRVSSDNFLNPANCLVIGEANVTIIIEKCNLSAGLSGTGSPLIVSGNTLVTIRDTELRGTPIFNNSSSTLERVTFSQPTNSASPIYCIISEISSVEMVDCNITDALTTNQIFAAGDASGATGGTLLTNGINHFGTAERLYPSNVNQIRFIDSRPRYDYINVISGSTGINLMETGTNFLVNTATSPTITLPTNATIPGSGVNQTTPYFSFTKRDNIGSITFTSPTGIFAGGTTTGNSQIAPITGTTLTWGNAVDTTGTTITFYSDTTGSQLVWRSKQLLYGTWS